MKMRVFYKIFALAFLAFIFQSRRNGPGAVAGLKVTGAPTDNGTCANAGCHGGGSFDPVVTIELLENGNTVAAYVPGSSYTLRVTNTPGNGVPGGFGFQALAIDAALNGAGTWGVLGDKQHTVTLSGREYVEHDEPNNNNVFEMEWIAPVKGTGDVTFYSASNAANLDDNTSGDSIDNTSLTVGEDNPSATSSTIRQNARLSIFPNPVNDALNLEIASRTSGNFNLRFFDVSWKIVKVARINLNSGINEKIVNVSDLQSGFYLVQLSGEAQLTSTKMLKL